MTRPAKVLSTIALAILALPVCATLLLAGSLITHGVVTVEVHQTGPGGTTLYLPVPAGLLYLGMDLLPLFDRGHELRRARREIGDWAPFVAAAMQSIEECPDAVLVDVRDGAETVKIVKEGRKLRVRVHDRDGSNVEISLPSHLFTRLGHQLI
jgi:hypothetical protein